MVPTPTNISRSTGELRLWGASNEVCPHPNQGGVGEHQVGCQNFQPWSELSPPNSHLHQAVVGESHSSSSNKGRVQNVCLHLPVNEEVPTLQPDAHITETMSEKATQNRRIKNQNLINENIQFQLKTNHHTKKQDLQTTPRGQRC